MGSAHWRLSAIFLATAWAVGCSSDGTLPDAGPGADAAVADVSDTGTTPPDSGIATPDAGEADAGALAACDPALDVERAEVAVLPLDLYAVVARGGTGGYRFELSQNESGAIVNELSGAYLSGELPGVTDIVRVTDVGCIGEASTTIRVVEALEIRPSSVEAPLGTTFTFETVGGSGQVSFTMLTAGTGGTVTPAGLYVSGPTEGTDRISVRDLRTGQTATGVVMVTSAATFAALPPFVYVPVGEQMRLGLSGGSGFVDVVSPPAFFGLSDGRNLEGLSAGRATVTLRDRFTGQTSALAVNVVAPQSFDPIRAGDNLLASVLLTPGDLDGDGYSDLILSHPEANITASNSGAVYVYGGRAGGINPVPVQVLGGKDRRDELGRAIVTGDFDGDGQIDLAVGTPRVDVGGSDTGVVEIYLGRPGGHFATQPAQRLVGRFAGDLFGWALTACDFNADGFLDLAVGAFNAEDRDRSPQATNQGGIHVFLGRANGFREASDIALWGDVPNGAGGFTGMANLHLGIALAAGDVDGDRVCDLVAGTYEFDSTAANTNDGLVYVFRGVARSANDTGGVETRPARAWANLDPADFGGQLGRNLAVGDLNGDGRADIIASHHGFDAGNGDSHGAARVYLGSAMTGPITELGSATPADWQYVHSDSGDQVGFSVLIAEVTGDQNMDVVLGNILDEAPGGPTNAGTLMIFAGRAGELPDVVPTRIVSGVTANDRIGAAVAALGDTDGDGRPELVGFAYTAADYGPDVGAPFLVRGDESMPLEILQMPGEASGMRFGQAGAPVGDIDGDGIEDLVVGAPFGAAEGIGNRSGRAFFYSGTLSGYETQPALELRGFPQHSAFDNFGWAVADAGDFDGDGRSDFAVIARFEDMPSTFNNTIYAPEAGCTGTRNNSGAVFVFRGENGAPSGNPAFIIFGPFPDDGIRELAGDFDYDGDGRDDLMIGSLDFDRGALANTGGFTLVRGRPASQDGRIVVICDHDFVFLGLNAGDNLGRSVTAIGDVNGDGCDEVAAGAQLEDPVLTNEGSVRVLFGFGGAGCPAQPTLVALRSGIVNSQAGSALAGGVDLDGDGANELAVGAPFVAANGSSVGAAVVIYGGYLAGLPREPAVETAAPTFHSFFDASRPPAVVIGPTPGEQFGLSVGLARSGAAGVLLAGSPLGDVSGTTLSGGARAYLYGAGGLGTTPVLAFAGESRRPGGLLGDRLAVGRRSGAAVAIVGGYDGSGTGLDVGSLYALDLSPP